MASSSCSVLIMEARFSEAFGCVEQHVELFWREKKKKSLLLAAMEGVFTLSKKKKKNLILLLILNTFLKIFRKSYLVRCCLQKRNAKSSWLWHSSKKAGESSDELERAGRNQSAGHSQRSLLKVPLFQVLGTWNFITCTLSRISSPPNEAGLDAIKI